MDLVVEEEEDRISKLPDDIIHLILSFLEMKYAVQASTLSKRWNHIWTLMPQLNLDRLMFCGHYKFSEFVKHVLSDRNNQTDVSTLRVEGLRDKLLLEEIVKYAYLHNVKKMALINFSCLLSEFPQYFFCCHTLKNLTLTGSMVFRNIPNSVWDFPALETLNLKNIHFGDGNEKSLDVFSKCVKIKDVTLHECDMEGLETFNIFAPQLVNLTITKIITFPNLFNVVAPQLKNLTAFVGDYKAYYLKSRFIRLSTQGFTSLEKVNLSMPVAYYSEEVASRLLNLFHVVRSAKLLILDVNIIKCLSSYMDQLSLVPSPFNNLKCLKLNFSRRVIPTQAIIHLLAESPNATFIMDLPEVPKKRLRQHELDDTLPMKVAKLEEKLRMKDQVIAGQNTNLLMNAQVIANQNANIQMKDEVIANQNTDIHMKDQVIANQKAMIQMLKSDNIHVHSDIPLVP